MTDHKKKRSRTARPQGLQINAFLFMLLPFLNYFLFSLRFKIDYLKPLEIINSLNYLMMALIFIPFILALGIFFIQRWAWWLLVIYSILATAYHSYVAVVEPELHNLGAVLQIGFLVFVFGYFIRKEISAPFFKKDFRGWRDNERVAVRLDVNIAGKDLKTYDFSNTGFYAEWPECNLQERSAVAVTFTLGKKKYDMLGGVARVDKKGIAIALRNLDRQTKKEIKQWLFGQ